MLSTRERQRYENFERLWGGYQEFCPGVELEQQMVIDSLPAVNEHLQEHYGRWRADAYTWNIWLPSVYGHLILCRMFGMLKEAIDDAIQRSTETVTVLDPSWRRIYLEGCLGHFYGQVAYADHRLIAPQLENLGEHYQACHRLCASKDETVWKIYSRITALRSQLPCEPRTNLPGIPLITRWREAISARMRI